MPILGIIPVGVKDRGVLTAPTERGDLQYPYFQEGGLSPQYPHRKGRTEFTVSKKGNNCVHSTQRGGTAFMVPTEWEQATLMQREG